MIVPNWRNVWKWFSVHCMALGASFQAAWLYLPDSLKMRLTDREAHAVALFIFVAGILGRLIDQSPPK